MDLYVLVNPNQFSGLYWISPEKASMDFDSLIDAQLEGAIPVGLSPNIDVKMMKNYFESGLKPQPYTI